MINLNSAGKYNSIKERKYKIATVLVFICTAVIYITLVLLMITTKFRILSPLIKFKDSVVNSYNSSNELEKNPEYNSDYINAQLQETYESSPNFTLYPVCLMGILTIIGQGFCLIPTRKKGKLVFSDSAVYVKINAVFDTIMILALLFVTLWLSFGSMSEIGSMIEPSKIYGWLFLLPLILLNLLFVSVFSKAAYIEENYSYKDHMERFKSHQQRSNVVFCKKCGEPIDNSMTICEECENKSIHKEK